MPSPSIIVLQRSEDSSALGFSLWVEKIKGVENQVLMGEVGDNKVAVKSLEKSAQGEPEKRLCMCSPTNHPGSFRCRYHRSTPTQNLKPVQNNAAMRRDFLKVKSTTVNAKSVSAGAKPPLSRLSNAAAVKAWKSK